MRSLSPWTAVALLFCTLSPATAAPPEKNKLLNSEKLGELIGSQLPQRMVLHITDSKGTPIENATVTPWALRSSQGHGWWHDDGEDRSGMMPKSSHTDAEGNATVWYPLYRDEKEQTKTTSVTVLVDHPRHAFKQDTHIDVPLADDKPFDVKLAHGTSLLVRPIIDGKPADPQDITAMSSDGRSWHDGYTLQRTEDGRLKFPAIEPGDASVLLVRLQDGQATHFSRLYDFQAPATDDHEIEIELVPATRVRGRLSDNVPRPVKNGRIKVETLPPKGASSNRVMWTTWAPIDEEGNFVIDAWPTGEAIQIISLCEGFIAKSGIAPPEVDNPRDPDKDPFYHPQVFRDLGENVIELKMTPMAKCQIKVIDFENNAVADVKVHCWPNVGWWNTGSQVYCHPLVRGEALVLHRDYFQAVDETIPQPFTGTTDLQGEVTIELPPGKRGFTTVSDDYELPVFLGRRQAKVDVELGPSSEFTLQVQRKGLDNLGQWDKLAGVIFGCSTKEGQRICALPEVRAKMDKFAEAFREAKDKRDPKLLAEAFATVAEAFEKAGDPEEAAKWQAKAELEREKLK